MTRKDYDVEHLVRLLQGLKGAIRIFKSFLSQLLSLGRPVC